MKTLLYTTLLVYLTGCAPYKLCTPCAMERYGRTPEDKDTSARRIEAAQHWLYSVVPRHQSQIRWYDIGHWITWGLFGNDDDGIFGEEPSANYHCDSPIKGSLALRWTLRNPLHNFCFYVIGTASQSQHSELAILQLARNDSHLMEYRPEAETVFAGKHSGLFIGLHGGLPFVSLAIDYGRRLELYVGWRERGNFGIKFVPAKKLRTHSEIAENVVASEADHPI